MVHRLDSYFKMGISIHLSIVISNNFKIVKNVYNIYHFVFRQCTWEPEENILDPRLIKDFEERSVWFMRILSTTPEKA